MTLLRSGGPNLDDGLGHRPGTGSAHEPGLSRRLSESLEAWRLLGGSVRLVWQAARREFLVVSALQVSGALLTGGSLLLIAVALGSTSRVGQGDFVGVLPILALMAAVAMLTDIVQMAAVEQSQVLAELVSRRTTSLVLDVASRVDLITYEDPAFHDRLRRARLQGPMRTASLAQGLIGLIGSSTSAIAVIGALGHLQPVLVPFMVVGYVPLVMVGARNSRDLYGTAFELTPDDRERAYLEHLLASRDAGAEVRSYNLVPFLRTRHSALYELRIAKMRRIARRRMARNAIALVSSSAALALGLGVLVWLYVAGRIAPPSAGAATVGIFQLSTRLRTVHGSGLSLYEGVLFVRDYASFLRLEPESSVRRKLKASFATLSVEGVSFSYPGTRAPALHEVSLSLLRGQTIALVGENGSGKSTLVKVLAGLYAPTSGAVYWDDIDVQTLDVSAVREQAAVIFQDFQRYKLTAYENVALGRSERFDDRDAVLKAAELGGAASFVQRLPNGYDTPLGSEFAGATDLSVGQWQRVALSRAFFRDAPLVILDEPTASMDARAESELFRRIARLLADRTVVLVSHRLASVRSADCIYVLEHGRVVEAGSHDELIRVGGLYAELFELQAAGYAGAQPPSTRPWAHH